MRPNFCTIEFCAGLSLFTVINNYIKVFHMINKSGRPKIKNAQLSHLHSTVIMTNFVGLFIQLTAKELGAKQ